MPCITQGGAFGPLRELEVLLGKLRAQAAKVGSYGWGASVSEVYHEARMCHMDAMRELLVKIDKAEKKLLGAAATLPIAGTSPTDSKEGKGED